MLEPLLGKHKVSLRIESTGDATVEALAGETRQVLLNLVRNAIEASSAQTEVTVHLTPRNGNVEIVVADQGTGIPPEFLDDLFLFGKSTKGERGNGMGLWTVKHILDRHHAHIEVRSVQGVGTTFTIHWPAKFTTQQQPAVIAVS